MSSRRVFQPARLLWLSLALSGVLSSADDARAGCGGHVQPADGRLDVALFSLDPGERLRPGSAPTDTPRPCTGPSCSQRGNPPMATPSPDRPPPDRCIDPGRAEIPGIPSGRSVSRGPVPAYDPPAVDRPHRPPRP